MAQRFNSLLRGSQALRPLLAQTQVLANLQGHFASVAPPYLAQTCQVLGLRHGTLTIAAANASAAAKLRQLAPELAARLQNRGCEVSGIRVKVQVTHVEHPRAGPARKLGETARSALHDFSKSLDDSPLRKALERLAEKSG